MVIVDIDVWLNEFYPKIVEDFGFSVEEDERAARLMHDLGGERLLDCSVLRERIEGRDVVVVGGAVRGKISVDPDHIIVTAGKSILKIRRFLPNFTPDVHVTDMEEPDEVLVELERKGCTLVLHAHGDNVHRIQSVVPKLGRFVATTQSKPFGRVYNFGGFTDGDRTMIGVNRLGG